MGPGISSQSERTQRNENLNKLSNLINKTRRTLPEISENTTSFPF